MRNFMIAGGARLRTSAARPRRPNSPWLVFLLTALLPVGWVGLCFPFTPVYQPAARSRQIIRRDNLALRAFLRKYKKTPVDLNELRSFAAVGGLPFSAYDAYGQRLDYLRLDDKHYLLRSYGDDQVQNTALSTPDMGIVHWGERPTSSLVYTEAEGPDFYPAALLAGADAPGKTWLARLFVDPENRTRHLLVRSLIKPGLFMVAPHDEVEEFLWLPSGQQLVFTGTASTRYRDGLYLWDLRSDRVTSLIDAVQGKQTMSPAKGADRLWLALAGLIKRGPTVLVYHHPRHDGGLSPDEFFVPQQLLAIAIPDEKAAKARLANPSEWTPGGGELLRQLYDVNEHITGSGGMKIQRQWLKLKLAGDLEQVLLGAQQVSDSTSETPLFPYSLWLLAVLYSQSFSLEGVTGSATKAALRAYGAEIARVLLNDPLAPSYLRGLALSGYGSLMEGRPLPYRISRLVAPSGGVTVTPAPAAGSK